MGQKLNQELNRLSAKASVQRGWAKRQKPPIKQRDKIRIPIMMVIIMTTIALHGVCCLSLGRICVYNLVNPRMIFIIIIAPNIYFEGLFPRLHSKRFSCTVSFSVLNPYAIGAAIVCAFQVRSWNWSGKHGPGRWPMPSRGPFSVDPLQVTFRFLSLFTFGHLWILSGFTAHCCHRGHCKRKWPLFCLLHMHTVSHMPVSLLHCPRYILNTQA